MGDSIKEVTKKVFYIIKRGTDPVRVREFYEYDAAEGTFDSSGEPTRFTGVTAALAAITRRGQMATNQYSLSLPLSIVRVEETPGSEERVVLGETQEAPAGSTVKYAVKSNCSAEYAINLRKEAFSAGRWTDHNELHAATLFNTQAEAIDEIVANSIKWATNYATVVRVAVQPSAPKYTETVLA